MRERIERVAVTDFTLIEGGSGPGPHPNCVEVFDQAAAHDSDRAVERAEVEADAAMNPPQSAA